MTTDQPDLTADRARPRSCPTCRSIGASRPILSGTPGEVCRDQWHADPFAHLPLPERIEARAADIAAHAATIRARSEALDLALGRELPQSMLMGTLPDGPDRSGPLIGFEPMDDAGYPPESGGAADVPWLDQLAAASVRAAEAKFEPTEAVPCLFADEHVRWRTTVFGGEVLAGQRATAQGIIGTLVDCSTCGPGHLVLDPDEMQPGDLVEDEDGAPLPDEQQPWGSERLARTGTDTSSPTDVTITWQADGVTAEQVTDGTPTADAEPLPEVPAPPAPCPGAALRAALDRVQDLAAFRVEMERRLDEGAPVDLLPEVTCEATGLDVDQQLRAAALQAAATFLAPTEEANSEQVIDLASMWVPWLRDGVLPASDDNTRSQA